jgi:hypothetical protein
MNHSNPVKVKFGLLYVLAALGFIPFIADVMSMLGVPLGKVSSYLPFIALIYSWSIWLLVGSILLRSRSAINQIFGSIFILLSLMWLFYLVWYFATK